MKWTKSLLNIALLAVMVTLMGCASSESGIRGDNEEYDRNTTVKVDNPAISLDDYLRRIPGVTVQGSGHNARVKVRGINSFMSSTDPLFVIDGVRVGRNFSNVVSMVSVADVDNIEVLKGPDASIYGVEGGNGVIIITTKRSS